MSDAPAWALILSLAGLWLALWPRAEREQPPPAPEPPRYRPPRRLWFG